ncbi:MAG: hypothetical protein E7Z98_07005 [Olsenella sp.]|nr:hypothetical protein [Olsenella sp.]
MVVSIVAVMAMYYFAKLVSPIASARLGVDRNLLGICLRSVLTLVVFIALGGARWLRPSLKAVGHAWRFMGYLIVLQVLLGVISVISNAGTLSDAQLDALDGDTLNAILAYITVLCLFVGINEEVMFRGIFLGGLLYLPKAIQAVRRLMRLEEPQLGPFMGDGAPEARGAHLG